jgi:murein L,D-transpeptidase YafK
MACIPASTQSFKEQQLENGRVKKAYQEKARVIYDLLQFNDLDIHSLELFIRVFKNEKKLEIWGRDSLHENFVMISSYHICRVSGKAGPKRKQGDLQIPEGFYYVDRFNPWSSFHLSLGIDYPNSSDRILSENKHLGGEIYIHGSCVTIGCIPMTDTRIEEIYIFAVEAANNGQEKIPIHIFPMEMRGIRYNAFLEHHKDNGKALEFWSNLEEGYLYFEENRILPDFEIDKKGAYCFR